MEPFSLLAMAAFLLSLVALSASARRYGRWLMKKRVDELSARVLHLESMQEKYEHQQRNLLARVSMRSHREKKNTKTNGGVPDPAEDPLGWKHAVSGLRK